MCHTIIRDEHIYEYGTYGDGCVVLFPSLSRQPTARESKRIELLVLRPYQKKVTASAAAPFNINRTVSSLHRFFSTLSMHPSLLFISGNSDIHVSTFENLKQIASVDTFLQALYVRRTASSVQIMKV